MPQDVKGYQALPPHTTKGPGLTATTATGTTNITVGATHSMRRKRRGTYASKACTFCREKKTACDGKPVCFQCLRRSLKCEYRTVSQTILNAIPAGSQIMDKAEAVENADAAVLLGILKHLPEEKSLKALHLLKQGYRPADIGSAFRGHSLGLPQLPFYRAGLPPTHSSLEFELMMRHPVAYPAWAPVQSSNLEMEQLLLPSKIRGKQSSGFTQLIVPPRPSKLYGNRLLGVEITHWTNIPISNDFAIAVLQNYFETDHPLIPLFDVDLFLDGLLCMTQFCSRLLVSAIFAWACQGYATYEPESTMIGHAFYEEAKKLWQQEKTAGADHICTVAAVHYLAITAISLGAGAEYVEYLHEALEMAKRLGLFNVSPSEGPDLKSYGEPDAQRATAQTAWALFNCLTIYYHLIVLDLFRPLIRQNDVSTLRLRSFTSKQATPEAVYKASTNQLKRIVLFYRQAFPESSSCLFWHSALLYLANAILREAKTSGQSPEWRFYFRLCIASYQTLYCSFRLAKGITISLLSMGLERGFVGVRYAKAVRRDLELRGKHHDVSDRVPHSLVVDLDLAVTDPSAAQAERLVQRFQELKLHETENDEELPAGS
ncbi:C6 zinc finger domain-containing protein [Colletotrichum incanum]|nr:C6 zinc finger domain-containing protein [Colletotrichum incanum]